MTVTGGDVGPVPAAENAATVTDHRELAVTLPDSFTGEVVTVDCITRPVDDTARTT